MKDKNWYYKEMQAGRITHLRYFMYEQSITTAELSKMTGINKRTLDDYVSGRRDINNIGLKSGLRIAEALDVDIYDLI